MLPGRLRDQVLGLVSTLRPPEGPVTVTVPVEAPGTNDLYPEPDAVLETDDQQAALPFAPAAARPRAAPEPGLERAA